MFLNNYGRKLMRSEITNVNKMVIVENKIAHFCKLSALVKVSSVVVGVLSRNNRVKKLFLIVLYFRPDLREMMLLALCSLQLLVDLSTKV